MSLNIDKEWANFISSSFDDDISDDEDIIENFVEIPTLGASNVIHLSP